MTWCERVRASLGESGLSPGLQILGRKFKMRNFVGVPGKLSGKFSEGFDQTSCGQHGLTRPVEDFGKFFDDSVEDFFDDVSTKICS